MKMFKENISFCLFLVIFGFTVADVNECYACNGMDERNCNDPFNNLLIKPTECNSLDYTGNTISRSNEDILIRVENSSYVRGKSNGNSRYVCLKYNIKAGAVPTNDTNLKFGLSRTCLKVFDDKDPCSVLKEDAANNGAYVFNSCNTCKSDNCNSGNLYKSSGILIGIISFIATL